MLFYMQMRNWFLIFMVLTIAYLIQKKTFTSKSYALKSGTSLISVIR